MDIITVPVTADHINQGIPGDAFACMLAIAVRDALGVEKVGVGRPMVWVHDDAPRLSDRRYQMSKPLMSQVDDFDHRRPVTPFVAVIDEAARSIDIEEE